jgi:hypothetical protein
LAELVRRGLAAVGRAFLVGAMAIAAGAGSGSSAGSVIWRSAIGAALDAVLAAWALVRHALQGTRVEKLRAQVGEFVVLCH